MAGLVDLVAGLRCRITGDVRKAAPGIRAPASLRPFAMFRGHACGVTIYVLPHFFTYGYIGHRCIGTMRPNEGADGSSGPRYAEPSDGQTDGGQQPGDGVVKRSETARSNAEGVTWQGTQKTAATEGCLTPSTGSARWTECGSTEMATGSGVALERSERVASAGAHRVGGEDHSAAGRDAGRRSRQRPPASNT